MSERAAAPTAAAKFPFVLSALLAALVLNAGARVGAQTPETAAPASSAEEDFEAALFGSSDAAPESAAPAGAPANAGEAAPGTAPAAGGGFAAAAASADVARIEYLVGGTVVMQAAATRLGGDGGILSVSDAAGKLFARVSVPDYGALFISYTLSQAFFQGYSGDDAPPAAADPYAPVYELSELHYSFDIAKRLFVRIGNQLIAWGPSRIWSPVDFINLEKSDAFAQLDSRAGKSGLRLHLPLGRANLFGFADFSALAADGFYGDPAESVNLGGRLDFTAGSFEFGAGGYGGANAQARFGADASGRLFGSTVYGEFALAPAYGDYEMDALAALGFSRALGDLKLWTLSAEGFYRLRGKDLGGYSAQEYSALPEEERTPLYQGRYYAYAALSAKELFSPSFTATLSAIANLSDLSFSLKLSQAFAFPRSVPFTFALSWSGGGEDKEFTRFAGDGAIAATLSARLEF